MNNHNKTRENKVANAITTKFHEYFSNIFLSSIKNPENKLIGNNAMMAAAAGSFTILAK
tara:strand:- start:137 stop:313 length:177 start_codon:yes stop_codon:yes gene_type:complete